LDAAGGDIRTALGDAKKPNNITSRLIAEAITAITAIWKADRNMVFAP
jgi:hypothetical protein